MSLTPGSGVNPFALFVLPVFLEGLQYSLPILTILTAHEFGHYVACRYHNVDCTLPYYLPAPFVLTGTFGAVIRIREPFPSRKALFDIGVAGPIAGFVLVVPFLVAGMFLSTVAVVPPGPATLYFGEPLLWKLVERLHFGVLENGADVMFHPVSFAAWLGMLVTAVNLLPFGQMDGGHITHALIGRRSTWVSAATLALVVGLSLAFWTLNWAVLALIMSVMAWRFGLHHPPTLDELEPLDTPRRLVALFALVMFVICFTPVPIEMLGG